MNHRVMVYKWNNNGSWELSKRFYDYPHELSINSSSLYLFSPSLKRYVHYCKDQRCLVIKCTLLEDALRSEKIKIPIITDLSCEADAKLAARRFTWISNNSFLISSNWGFEKFFAINDDNTCTELGSSQIPSYSQV